MLVTYKEKYNELVELSHSENSEIKEKADTWQTIIVYQDGVG